jgi:general secretion pathway protein K
MAPGLRDSQGFAVLLTIMVISLMVTVTLDFNTSMREELFSAVNVYDGISLKAVARSGVDLAMAVLHEKAVAGGPEILGDDWADPALLSSVLTSLFPDIEGDLKIIDASRKININKIVDENGEVNLPYRNLLGRFLSLEDFGLKAAEIEDLLDAITDWMDPDDEVTMFGAESPHYLSLERPRTCRNGPMQSVGELLLVRGVTPGLLYGNDEHPGIFSFLTVYGDGRININTAHPMVLRALSERIDSEMAGDMAAYREDKDEALSEPGWYKQVPGMSDVVIDSGLVSVDSSHFEVVSYGVKGKMRRKVHALIEKSEGNVRLVSWKSG